MSITSTRLLVSLSSFRPITRTIRPRLISPSLSLGYLSYSTGPPSPDIRRRLILPYTKPQKINKKLWRVVTQLRITVLGRPAVIDQESRGMPKAAYYAVASGRRPGVYTTWTEAEAQVKGYAGAKYKKFPTQAQAEEFISGSGSSSLTSSTSSTTSKNNKPYSKPSTSTSTSGGFNTHHRAESPTTSCQPSDLPQDLQEIASRGYEFTKDYYLIVHTDGSALGNGQKGSRAGAGVFWGGYGEALKKNYSERVPGLPQTNNRGELLAVIRALEQCPYPDIPLEIRCDSQYTISCMTTWLPKWLRNDFTTSTNSPYSRPNGSTTGQVQKQKQISNVDMVKHLLVLLRRRSGKGRVKFKYVPAHSGIEGNERADQLAKMGSLMPESNDPVKWLTPEEEDELSSHVLRGTTSVEGVKEVTNIEVELDENWLMSPEELENFEKDLIDESNEG